MKLITILAFLVCSCATVKPVTDKVVPVEKCATDEMKAQVGKIAQIVFDDLSSKNYDALLASLANQVKDDAVVCAVQASVTKTSFAFSSVADPVYVNGNAWLRAHGHSATQ
jgi:hypothetical protein